MKHRKIIFISLLLLLTSFMSLLIFAQGVGYIQVKCEPGAIVFLDNNLVGKTSSELGGLILQDVPAGSHQIKIVKEGFEPQSVKIDLKVNEIYVYEVKEFIPQLDVTQEGEADTDTIKQRVGSILIETIPIDCLIEIPKLNINKEHYGNKIKKTWEISNIPIGSYSVNFIALGKKIEYELKIEEGIKKHLLVNVLKNEVKEIVLILTWDKTFGGNDDDRANSLIQTTDGGYAVAGETQSYDAGAGDFWVIKLDSRGNKLWDKTFGGRSTDRAYSLIQTTDDGYAVAGYTYSYGVGENDFWVIKLDSRGNKLWDKTFGGSNNDFPISLIQTTDGSYAVAGGTRSYGAGDCDVWVIKLDNKGNKLWDKTFGGNDDDRANSLIQTTDGGYAIAGYVNSQYAYDGDFWVIKMDSKGNKVWDKTFGGNDGDRANSLIQTADGGYAIAGFTESYGAGGCDVWVIKLDSRGNKLWDKTFGGNESEKAYSLIQTTDGGYGVAGYTRSYSASLYDFWVIKLDSWGNKVWDKTFSERRWDMAYSIIQTTDGGYAVAGETKSYGDAGEKDVWVIKLDEQGNLKQ